MATPWKDMTVEQKARAAAASKRYWARNREKLAAKKNKHYHAHRDHYLEVERERSYKKLYNITMADYSQMLAAQDNKCAICSGVNADPKGRLKYFCVDHCHETGRVRGLLCLACNHLLGRYEKHMDAIHAYLGKRND